MDEDQTLQKRRMWCRAETCRESVLREALTLPCSNCPSCNHLKWQYVNVYDLRNMMGVLNKTGREKSVRRLWDSGKTVLHAKEQHKKFCY